MPRTQPDDRSEIDPRTRVCDAFERRFVRAPDFLVRAPGRVNLIGEHTDYTGGRVLPFATDRALYLAVGVRDDSTVRAHAADLSPEQADREFHFEDEEFGSDFAQYLKGAAAAVREAGGAPRGLDLAIASNLPIGSGLSSSAALCVASVLALDAASGIDRTALDVARRAHRAESHFVGTGCGILDPFAIALCGEGAALRIDCGSERTRRVPLPTSELACVISHSGVSRSLASEAAGAGYRTRVEETSEALAQLRRDAAFAQVAALGELIPDQLDAAAPLLAAPLFARVRHLVEENARVDRVCALLEATTGTPVDARAIGAQLKASHASLRDDYAVSIPQLDELCEYADALPGVHGSRMVGAGFGGCVLHLVDASRVEEVAEAMREHGRGRKPVFIARADRGAAVETGV